MEQSKLSSLVIAKLKLAYPYYFKQLSSEEFCGLISIYQEELKAYNLNVVIEAINEIIKKNKYMPAISEIISKCEKIKFKKAKEVLAFMLQCNYFKNVSEFEKAIHFVETNCIPQWLREDMIIYSNQYSSQMKKQKLEDKSKMLLDGHKGT